MGCQDSSLNKTFIIEPLSMTASTVLSACTTVFTNFVQSCSGNTSITLSTGIISFIGSLSASSISATTYYGNGSNLTGLSTQDTKVTGGTFNQSTRVATFTNNTGGTFTVTGFTDTFTTAATYNNGLVYFNRNDQLSAYTLNLSAISGDANTFVTGVTLSSNTLTITRNDSVSISVDLSGIKFTGGSTNCIANLYVTNILGCSPITFWDSLKHNGSTVSGTSSIAFGLTNINLSDYSGIIGGTGNTLTSGATRSLILGGRNITGTSSDTVYIPNVVSSGVTSNIISATTISGDTMISGGTNLLNIFQKALTVSNGLTLAGNALKLGGLLTQTTTINGAQTLNLGTTTLRLSQLNGFSTTQTLFFAGNSATTGSYSSLGIYGSANNYLGILQSTNGTDLSSIEVTPTDITFVDGALTVLNINGGNLNLTQNSYFFLNNSAGFYNSSVLVNQNNLIFFTDSGLTKSYLILNDGANNWEDDTTNGSISLSVGSNLINLSNPNNSIQINTGVGGLNLYGNLILNNALSGKTLNLQSLSTDNSLTNILVIDNNNEVKKKNLLSLSITGLTATTISASTYLNLPQDVFATGMTLNAANYNLTVTRNDGNTFTANLGILSSDVTITGGTYNINTGIVTFTNNTGGTFQVSGFSSGMTDTNTYITGTSFTNNILSLTNNSGLTLTQLINNLSGLTINGTASATTLNSNTISATTISGTTFFGNGSNLTNIVDSYITGITFTNNNLTLTNNTGRTNTVLINTLTGLTVNGTLNSNVISSTTFTNLTSTINNLSGNSITASTFQSNLISGTSITATTYFNLPTDIYTTGGTYSNGTLTLKNNSGGTFNVTGLYTGTLDVFVTSGSYNNSTGTATFTNNTGGTFQVTGFLTGTTDSFVTGVTFNNNILLFTNNTGGTFNVLINNLSGLTINGNTTITNTETVNNIIATGITSNSLSATTITASTLQSKILSATTISGQSGMINAFSANTISATTYFNLPAATVGAIVSATTISADTIYFKNLSGNSLTASTLQSNILSATTLSADTIYFKNLSATTLTADTGQITTLSATTISAQTTFTKVLSATTISASSVQTTGTVNATGGFVTTGNASIGTFQQAVQTADCIIQTRPASFKDIVFKSSGTTPNETMRITSGGTVSVNILLSASTITATTISAQTINSINFSGTSVTGFTFTVKSGGTSSSIGQATLVGGTILVSNTLVTTSSIIMLSIEAVGVLANASTPYISAKVAGTSFTISSLNVLDTSTIGWWIIEPK